MNVVEHGARGVGGICCMFAVGEIPQQPAIHGAKGQFAALSSVASAGDIIKNPGNLGG